MGLFGGSAYLAPGDNWLISRWERGCSPSDVHSEVVGG